MLYLLMRKFSIILILFICVGFITVKAHGFGEVTGSCESDCIKCHRINMDEATDIVRNLNSEIEVLELRPSEVRGLWEIIVKARGKRGIAYIDFSKKHLITGSIIKVENRENITNKRLYEMSKVDVTEIPLEDALILGDPEARFKAIVFDDPDCPYCSKLHREMKLVTMENPDIAFLIKMLPLKIHPAAYKKAKSIVCEKSMALLERAFAGRKLPEPRCETTEVDETMELAERLGITSTPTIILPDGGVVTGAQDADRLIEMIETSGLMMEELIYARNAELLAERQRKLKELEDADFAVATQVGTLEAYGVFLDKYPDATNMAEALTVMSEIIGSRPDVLMMFRNFVSKYPKGVQYIPVDYRIHYFGPEGLRIFNIIEMLEGGMNDTKLADKIRKTAGKYKVFSINEVDVLVDLGLTDDIIDALVEATIKARTIEEQQLRQGILGDLEHEIEAVKLNLYKMNVMLDTLSSEDDPEERATITDEEGTPLVDKIPVCHSLQKALTRCRVSDDIGRCLTSAKSKYLCQ